MSGTRYPVDALRTRIPVFDPSSVTLGSGRRRTYDGAGAQSDRADDAEPRAEVRT
jgi:hypothetical protein